MIDDRLPPLDCDTYQIHIPRPARALAAPVGCGAGAGEPTVEPTVAPPLEEAAAAAADVQAAASTAARTRRSLWSIGGATVAENPPPRSKLRCKRQAKRRAWC